MSAVQGIEWVISRLRATAMSAKIQDIQPQPTVSFVRQLHTVLGRTSDVRTASYTQVEKFTLDEPGITSNDVITDMQKASVSMQMGIQMRNKLVLAYQEVMFMQVQVQRAEIVYRMSVTAIRQPIISESNNGLLDHPIGYPTPYGRDYVHPVEYC